MSDDLLTLNWTRSGNPKSPMSRPVFYDIPGAMKLLLYTTLPLMFATVAYLFSVRADNWGRGQPD